MTPMSKNKADRWLELGAYQVQQKRYVQAAKAYLRAFLRKPNLRTAALIILSLTMASRFLVSVGWLILTCLALYLPPSGFTIPLFSLTFLWLCIPSLVYLWKGTMKLRVAGTIGLFMALFLLLAYISHWQVK